MLLFYLSLVTTETERDFIVKVYGDLNRRLLGYAYKLSHDKHWAQDATQQVFLVLISDLPKYNGMPDDKLAKYCFTIVRNSFFRWRKQNARLGDLELLGSDSSSEGSEIDDPLMRQIEREELLRALAMLSEVHRMVIIQKFFLERTHREIAEDMDISVSRSQNLLAEAMRNIREILGVEK